MLSQGALVGIIIGIFLAGLGTGFTIFLATSQPATVMPQTQIAQQVMMQSPQHRQQMIDQMLDDADFRQHMMESFAQNPQYMNQWMTDTEHTQQMSALMQENHDFMMEMMQVIMEDPSLRVQMIGHMTENQEVMQEMMQLMGSGGMMMGNMSDQRMMNP